MTEQKQNTKSNGCLVDTTRCIGCRSCQVACKQWNGLEAEDTCFRGTGGMYENPPHKSARTHTKVHFFEVLTDGGEFDRCVFTKSQCMHCLDPSCAAACPVTALEKTPEGPVIYHADRCMGCRYCMLACPFDAPTLEWDKPVAYIKKCTFCVDRMNGDASFATVNGQPIEEGSAVRQRTSLHTPSCAKACPTGAILYGERDQLLAEAHRRIAERKTQKDAPWQYVDQVYGEKTVGGTSWMYLANVAFDKLGMRTDLGDTPYPAYTAAAMGAVPWVVLGVGAAMGAAHWFTERRERLAAGAHVKAESGEEVAP